MALIHGLQNIDLKEENRIMERAVDQGNQKLEIFQQHEYKLESPFYSNKAAMLFKNIVFFPKLRSKRKMNRKHCSLKAPDFSGFYDRTRKTDTVILQQLFYNFQPIIIEAKFLLQQ